MSQSVETTESRANAQKYSGEICNSFLALQVANGCLAGRKHNQVGVQPQIKDLGRFEQAVVVWRVWPEYQRRPRRVLAVCFAVNGEVDDPNCSQRRGLELGTPVPSMPDFRTVSLLFAISAAFRTSSSEPGKLGTFVKSNSYSAPRVNGVLASARRACGRFYPRSPHRRPRKASARLQRVVAAAAAQACRQTANSIELDHELRMRPTCPVGNQTEPNLECRQERR